MVGVGLADVWMSDGTIRAVGAVDAPGAAELDATGLWIAPAVIDAHVHLAYLPQAAEMADGGVAGAVDLAAPLTWLPPTVPITMRAGPMVTAVDGYPTTSWGADGYGTECADASAAAAAVERHIAAGATVIKLAVTGEPTLTDDALAAAVAAARNHGVPVVAHALSDVDALRAAQAGADILAHSPVGALSPATVAAWADRAVISTLGAFGAAPTATANLAALHDAGATVLYGTDFGNSTKLGIDVDELSRIADAGLGPAGALAAATSGPAEAFGFDTLGSLAVGKAASALLLEGDPTVDVTAWGRLHTVIIQGAVRSAP